MAHKISSVVALSGAWNTDVLTNPATIPHPNLPPQMNAGEGTRAANRARVPCYQWEPYGSLLNARS